MCQRRSSCSKYRKWCSYFENPYHYAKIIDKKKINFSVTRYCTLLLSRKEIFKFSEVALGSVHCNCLKNVQVLVTEIFKVKNDLAPEIMKDVFELKEPPYNLRSDSNHFTRRNVKATYYGLSSIKRLALQICEHVPQRLRKCNTLNEFKTKIKSWYPDHCPYRLCKTYIAQLGFIWSTYIYLFMA